MKKALLLMPPLFAASLALMLYLQPAPETRPTKIAAPTSAPPQPERSAAEAPAPAVISNNVKPTPPLNLPPSFAGTAVDGGLHVDANGQLIIDEDVRRLFDYFLASIGEESLGASVERLRSYIDSQLGEPARSRAQALLDQYLDYKRELVLLERDLPQLANLDALRQREAAVQALRARLFDAETHQAFFAREEGYNRFTLERLAIAQDTRLDAEAKGQAIDRLRSSLPPELQDAVLPELQQELRQHTARLQAEGASAAQIRQMRQQLVGAEATTRLEALDGQRQNWQKRLNDYLAAKARVENNAGLSAGDRATALEVLAAERFDERERLRLEAAERLAASRKGG